MVYSFDFVLWSQATPGAVARVVLVLYNQLTNLQWWVALPQEHNLPQITWPSSLLYKSFSVFSFLTIFNLVFPFLPMYTVYCSLMSINHNPCLLLLVSLANAAPLKNTCLATGCSPSEIHSSIFLVCSLAGALVSSYSKRKNDFFYK